MTLYEYLRGLPEEMPAWLEQFRDGDRFSRQQFFGSRVVYYPGSRSDGHSVKVFGSTHSAHSFVHVDYDFGQDALNAELGHPQRGFRGYHKLSRCELCEKDLVPNGWTPHVDARNIQRAESGFATVRDNPFGFLEVLERDSNLDDNHGARRLAILFLGADGIATYDALFCQGLGHSVPFAVLLQDHGFGGNYNRFGRGGLLESIARGCDIVPQWLLVAENTAPWQGFRRVTNVEGDRGGMHSDHRFLYSRGRGRDTATAFVRRACRTTGCSGGTAAESPNPLDEYEDVFGDVQET